MSVKCDHTGGSRKIHGQDRLQCLRRLDTETKKTNKSYQKTKKHILEISSEKKLQIIIKGRINENRNMGRKRLSWFHKIINWTRMATLQLFRLAEVRNPFNQLLQEVII